VAQAFTHFGMVCCYSHNCIVVKGFLWHFLNTCNRHCFPPPIVSHYKVLIEFKLMWGSVKGCHLKHIHLVLTSTLIKYWQCVSIMSQPHCVVKKRAWYLREVIVSCFHHYWTRLTLMQEAPIFGFVVCMHHALCKVWTIWCHVTFLSTFVNENSIGWFFFKISKYSIYWQIPQVLRVK